MGCKEKKGHGLSDFGSSFAPITLAFEIGRKEVTKVNVFFFIG